MIAVAQGRRSRTHSVKRAVGRLTINYELNHSMDRDDIKRDMYLLVINCRPKQPTNEPVTEMDDRTTLKTIQLIALMRSMGISCSIS